MPWLQWPLGSRTTMIGITISNPNYNTSNGGGENLRNVEIRAGLGHLGPDFKGKISKNEICGKFEGPGDSRRAYTIMCEKEIVADYVTLQILDDNANLQINELEIITKSEGTHYLYNYVNNIFICQFCRHNMTT